MYRYVGESSRRDAHARRDCRVRVDPRDAARPSRGGGTSAAAGATDTLLQIPHADQPGTNHESRNHEREGCPARPSALHLARARRTDHQQARRRRIHARAHHSHERHRAHERHRVRVAALQARVLAHDARPAPAARAGAACRAPPADHGELAAAGGPVAARDDDRLRAGRDRGDGEHRAERAGSVPRAGLPLRPARGLRPPVSLLRPDGSRRRQGREQLPAKLHGHPARPPDRVRAPRAGGRPPPSVRSHDRDADHEAQRADPGRGRVPDARLLHDDRSDVLRPDRARSLRGDRVDRGAARHAVREPHRSRRDVPREVAAAGGDRGVQRLELPAQRASRRCWSRSWSTTTAGTRCSTSRTGWAPTSSLPSSSSRTRRRPTTCAGCARG